jgi:hypothetical protein
MLVYDPLTSHACVNGTDVSGTCFSAYIRNPFPGNVIPESRISPIGRKILAYHPAPNYPGMVNNYVAGTGGKYRYDQPMVKYDRVIDDNRLMLTFTFQDGSEYRNSSGIPGAAASASLRAPATSKES